MSEPKILDGKALAKEIEAELAAKVSAHKRSKWNFPRQPLPKNCSLR